MTYSDDALSSYLDGEADAALAAEIETAMSRDPALVARMEALGGNDDLLRAAFDEALGETPARLTAALKAGPAQAAPERSAPERSADVLAFRPRPKAKAKTPKAKTGAANFNWPKLAAASVVALAVGVSIGMVALKQQGLKPAGLIAAGDDGLAASHVLQAALASTPSGTKQPVGGQVLSVALSFRTGDGRLCRQFHLDGGQAADAVACRGAKGWRIEGWMPARPAGGGDYQTAGGEDAAATAMVDRLGVAKTLDASAEAAAIKGGWR